jgi:ABC-type bacteriocin/lantibiotic exporter with double-glycine peptidase domain
MWSTPSTTYTSPVPNEQPLCGVYAVHAVANLCNVDAELGTIRHFTGLTEQGVTLLDCKQALDEIGIGSLAVRFTSPSALPEDTPAICALRSAAGLHAVVVVRDGASVLVIDGPSTQEMSCKALSACCEPVALVVQRPISRRFS